MAVFNDGHDNQEDYKADLSWEYRTGGPNDPETYEPVEADEIPVTDVEFLEALAEEYRETGRPRGAVRLERAAKKLKEQDEPRYLIKAKNQKEAQAIFKEALRSARLGVALPAEVEIIPLDRPSGKWKTDDMTGIKDCDQCGRQAPIDITSGLFANSPFCPWCGATMEPEEEEEHGPQ